MEKRLFYDKESKKMGCEFFQHCDDGHLCLYCRFRNQKMVDEVIETFQKKWKGVLAAKWRKIMNVACLCVKQAEIENFANWLLEALYTEDKKNSETQLNDLETFTELIELIYKRKLRNAIEKFNQLISDIDWRHKGWKSENGCLAMLDQYCTNPQDVENFKQALKYDREDVY